MSPTRIPHVVRSCALASLLGLVVPLGCAKPPVHVTPPVPSTAPVANEEPVRGCPQLPRGKRIWTGFVAEVSDADLHIALDVVHPIAVALGEVFCAPEHARCRPHHFTKIELSDALLSAARVGLAYDASATEGSLELVMLHENGAFVPEPQSLASVLAPCVDSAVGQ